MPFKVVPGPFGGSDERATQEAFVEYVGGTRKADRLMYLWNDSYPCSTHDIFKPLTKEEVFRSKAIREGYTHEQISAFLIL